MSRYQLLASLVLGAGVSLAVACSGDRAVAPLPGGEPVLASVTGLPVTAASMRQNLSQATRLVALALGDPAVRAQVRRELDASPYREHKLHFGAFLRGRGRGLLAGMAAHRPGAVENNVLALLDSVVDLEFYMPVQSHRARWRGGRDLIVASALHDHEIPTAFDLDGNPVTLTSAEVAPDAPTLALVPTETDFSAILSADLLPTCDDICDGGTGGGSGGGLGGSNPLPGVDPSLAAQLTQTGGVVMTFADIPGNYEGFLMGNPEFEVHAFGKGTGTALKDYQCAGEHAATAADQPGTKTQLSVYDQNTETWNGAVMLLPKAEADAAQKAGAPVVYWIWEDDNTACKIVNDSTLVTTVMRGVPEALRHGWNAITALFKSDTTKVDSLKPQHVLADLQGIVTAFQNDDLVGFLVDAGEVDMSWPDANYAIVLRNPGTGQLEIRGRAKLVPVSE